MTDDYGSSNDNSAPDIASHAATAECTQTSESSALVQWCFMGLGLVHFAIAFWTRAWVMQLTLIFCMIAFLGLASARLRLLHGMRWLVTRLCEYIKDRLRTQRVEIEGEEESTVVADEEKTDATDFVPAALRVSFQEALRLEQHVSTLSN